MTVRVYAVRALAGDWLVLDGSTGVLHWRWSSDPVQAWTCPTWAEAETLAAHMRGRCAYPVEVERAHKV